MALEQIAEESSVSFKTQQRLSGELAEIGGGQNRLRLLMPNTFMNESGRSIQAAMKWFDLRNDQLLVIVDDMDLPLGKLRLRTKGGAGGHKGLRSTIQHLGTQDFCRLRIGIGGPICVPSERKAKTVSHVLGKFSNKESELVNKVLNEVKIGFDLIQNFGIEKGSNHLNSFQVEDCPQNL